MVNFTTANLDKVKDFAVTYLKDEYLYPGSSLFYYEDWDDDLEECDTTHTVVEFVPRPEEKPICWEEVQGISVLNAEITQMADAEILVKVDTQITGNSIFDLVDHEVENQQTRETSFIVAVCTNEGSYYVARVEEEEGKPSG